MSKVDAQRALRDARYARFAAAKSAEAAPAKKSPAKAPAAKAAVKRPAATSAAEELFSTPAESPAPATSEPTVSPSSATDPIASGLADPDLAAPEGKADSKAAATAPADAAGTTVGGAETAETETELCGHRSMNGRTCTRLWSSCQYFPAKST